MIIDVDEFYCSTYDTRRLAELPDVVWKMCNQWQRDTISSTVELLNKTNRLLMATKNDDNLGGDNLQWTLTTTAKGGDST